MYSRFNITCASVYICLICILGISVVLDIHTKTSTAMRLIKNSRLKTISSIICRDNLKAYSSIAQYSLRSEFSTAMYEFSLGNIIQIDINRSFSIVFHLICNIRRIDSLLQQQIVNGLSHAALCSAQYQEQYPDKQFCKMLHVFSFQKLYTVICYTLIPYRIRVLSIPIISVLLFQVSSVIARHTFININARICRIAAGIIR